MKTFTATILLFLNVMVFGQLKPNYFTTNGIPFPNWHSITEYGGIGDGVTDNTTAIQNAINAVTNSGGVIYFPPGKYLVDGAFTQPPGKALTNFCQLYLPSRDIITQPIVTIEFEGGQNPGFNTIWNAGTNPPVSTNGSIIFSTRFPTNNLYAIIGGGAPSGSSLDLSAVYFKARNLTFRTYDNPKTPCLNLEHIGQTTLRDCVFDTGQIAGAQSQPTNGAVAVLLPGISNWVISEVYNCDFRGYAVGLKVNEHSDIDDARFWMCSAAMWFPGGTHAVHIGHTVVTGCTRGVIGGAPGFVQRISWECYATEHSILTTNVITGDTTWANCVADFADTNGTLRGIINYSVVQSGVGASDNFLVQSGTSTNVSFFNLNTSAFQSLRIRPVLTNEPAAQQLFVMTRSNGTPIMSVGQLAQPFDRFTAIYLGAGSSPSLVSLATNFSVLSDSTNNLSLNIGNPDGVPPTNSAVHFEVGHVRKMNLSNNLFEVLVPMNHGFISKSNFVSGQLYTNPWAGPISLKANISLVGTNVAGSAAMQLWIPGVITNSKAINTSGLGVPNPQFEQLIGDVPAGGTFVFTNTSSGTGNTANLFAAEVSGD